MSRVVACSFVGEKTARVSSAESLLAWASRCSCYETAVLTRSRKQLTGRLDTIIHCDVSLWTWSHKKWNRHCQTLLRTTGLITTQAQLYPRFLHWQSSTHSKCVGAPPPSGGWLPLWCPHNEHGWREGFWLQQGNMMKFFSVKTEYLYTHTYQIPVWTTLT